jgi:hypothetical protein
MTSHIDARTAAEAAWRIAYATNDRRGTLASYQAEQEAWDAYTDICADLWECIEPGCRTVSPDHVYCEEHRPR